MLKSYCDICGEEIEEKALRGGVMRQKIVYPMMPVGPKGELSTRPGLSEELLDLCEPCQKWIFDLCKKRKEELLKKG